MAAARKKANTNSKAKRKVKGGASKKSPKTIKKPKRDTATKAPLAEMDAAWQSLLETALERHRAKNADSVAKGPKKK